jgi:hypothetical protein
MVIAPPTSYSPYYPRQWVNHHFQWVNPLFLWEFSIAMLVYQPVDGLRHFNADDIGRMGPPF